MASLIIYAILALGVVTFAGSVVHKYNSAVEGKVAAEAKLKTCSTDYATTLGQVRDQNVALKELKSERDKAQEISIAALKLADQQAARNEPERKRLAALERTFKSAGPCPAGEAVSEYRKGLKVQP